MMGCGWFFRLSGFVINCLICPWSASRNFGSPAVVGDSLHASHGGREISVFRERGKCLKTMFNEVPACIDSMIEALKPGASMALVERAKQKVVIVSRVKE